MINIYISDVSKLNISDEELLHLLSPERREKLLALLTAEKKRQCASAGLLLRHALMCRGLSPDTPVFKDANGKPYCSNMSFSLSHSGIYTLCATADGTVGADIEKINPVQSLETAKRFCTADELYGINLTKFFMLFTAKESYLKMTGDGLRRDMRSFKAADIANLQTFEYKGYMLSVCTETAQKAEICPVNLSAGKL